MHYKIDDELKEFDNDWNKQTNNCLNKQFEELVQATLQEQQDIDESAKSQDFLTLLKKDRKQTLHYK